jgi:hypothetical protein
MSLFGNMFRGASSASLWTGNMIYTALLASHLDCSFSNLQR